MHNAYATIALLGLGWKGLQVLLGVLLCLRGDWQHNIAMWFMFNPFSGSTKPYHDRERASMRLSRQALRSKHAITTLCI